ncbi:phage portal protein [Pseudomonas sp. AO-1]|uniref:phage portal protein n=1 Tax=Pseudomonas sp. AO-1 TaxID=2855434 RepID=UPI001C767291|nr:phage portal protein [Pseudomonas sp. AO-1]QXZ16094.1 phage portal protein [Pseudomonas sp. AO-1]
MSKPIKSVLRQALIKSAEPGIVKSSLSSWVGRRIGLGDSSFWNSYYGTDSASGKTVSQQTALQLSTVWACVRLIAETLATLPIALYEDKNGVPVVASSHPVHRVISIQPNADQTPVEFWECVVASLLLSGNSFNEPHRVRGELSSLEFLLPQSVSPPRRTSSGAIEYRFIDSDGRPHTLLDDEMMHTRGFGTDPMCGLSPLSMGRNVFGAAMAADESASKMFANGMKLGGVLSTDQILNKEQRNDIREDMAAKFAGAVNTGKTMVLEAGMKYQQVSMTPEDAQMLQTRAFNVEEICRWFRVPPWMVGHTSNSTSWGTGMEQQMLGFLSFTLLPWMKRIEQSINRRLLRPDERRRFYAKFNPEGLLRADSAARAAFYSSMTQNGIYTRDDCRIKENLAPHGGNAAKLTVQSNMLPIDKLGEGGGDAQKARSALMDWLNEKSEGNAE